MGSSLACFYDGKEEAMSVFDLELLRKETGKERIAKAQINFGLEPFYIISQ